MWYIIVVFILLGAISYIMDWFNEDATPKSKSDDTNSQRRSNTTYSSSGFYSKTGFGDLTGYKHILIERNGDCCNECGQTDIPLQVHHIIPVSKGGEDVIENMELLCYECHRKKHNHYFEELGSSNRTIPQKFELINWAYHNEKKIEIKYVKFDGTASKRVIKPLTPIYKDSFNGAKEDYYIKAFCYLRNEERIFKISRIESVKKIQKRRKRKTKKTSS